MSPVWAVMITALLFGAMHVQFDKVVPTAMLGLAMGYLVVRTGSIVPAMLFHLLNNTTAVVVNHPRISGVVEKWLEGRLGLMAVVVVVSLGVGVWLLERGRGSDVRPSRG